MFNGKYNIILRNGNGNKNWNSYIAQTDYFHVHDCPVEIQQNPYEFEQLLGEYINLQPKTIVEVGNYHGGTLSYWMRFAQPGSKIITIDSFCYTGHPSETQNLINLWQGWTSESITLENFVTPSNDPQFLKMFGPYIASVSENKFIDFLFIDGDHSYEGVKSDFINYGKYVRSGGIIALHDINARWYTPTIGVPQLWDEICLAGYKTRNISASPPEQLGIGVVYVE